MRRILLSLVVAAASVAVACGDDPSPTAPSGGTVAGIQTLIDVPLVDVSTATTGTFNYPGQSLTVPAGSFNNIRFNWYTFQRDPTAFGILYVVTQEYLALPGDLAAAPGIVGRSESIAADLYVFPSDVTLTGGVTYWFYGDTQGSFVTGFDLDIYRGGDLYMTGFPTLPFRKVPASGRIVGGTFVPAPAGVFTDANFKLQGSPK